MTARAVYYEPNGALPSTIEYDYGKAADGPDYGVSFTDNILLQSSWPHPVGQSGYKQAQPTVIPGNYGSIGPIDVRSNKRQDDDLLPWVALGPVNSPTYNSATPTGIFHLKVDNAEQFARWQVTNPNAPAPIPVSYNPAGTATLYSGR